MGLPEVIQDESNSLGLRMKKYGDVTGEAWKKVMKKEGGSLKEFV